MFGNGGTPRKKSLETKKTQSRLFHNHFDLLNQPGNVESSGCRPLVHNLTSGHVGIRHVIRGDAPRTSKESLETETASGRLRVDFDLLTPSNRPS